MTRYRAFKERGFLLVHLDEEGAVYTGGEADWRRHVGQSPSGQMSPSLRQAPAKLGRSRSRGGTVPRCVVPTSIGEEAP